MSNAIFRFIGKLSKVTLIVLASILILLSAIRIALPNILLDYANKVLSELREYDGYIKDIDLHIYRGAMD